jgi:hypothetical protein
MHFCLMLWLECLCPIARHGAERFPFDPRNLTRVRTPQALQLEVLADRLVEVAHYVKPNAGAV